MRARQVWRGLGVQPGRRLPKVVQFRGYSGSKSRLPFLTLALPHPVLASPAHHLHLLEGVLASLPSPVEPWNEHCASSIGERRSSLLGRAARRSPHSVGEASPGLAQKQNPVSGTASQTS